MSKLSTNIVTESADFGLAREQGTSTHSGTRSYLPPEFHSNHDQKLVRNSDSDIFALGMTLMDLYSSGRFDKKRYFHIANGPSPEIEIPKYIETEDMRYHHEIYVLDRKMFSNFVKACLELNPQKRLKPDEALRHPYLRVSIKYIIEE